jgi:hypothetical protein
VAAGVAALAARAVAAREAAVRAGLLILLTSVGGGAQCGRVLGAGGRGPADGQQHLAEPVERGGLT